MATEWQHILRDVNDDGTRHALNKLFIAVREDRDQAELAVDELRGEVEGLRNLVLQLSVRVDAIESRRR